MKPKKNPQGKQKKNGNKKPNLSKECSDYCKLLCDPYGAPSVALPAIPAVPSSLVRTYARSIMGTNTTDGLGYITMNPSNMVASDGKPLVYTSASWVATSTAALFSTDATTGVWSQNSDSPYVADDIGTLAETKLEYRLVAAELRITYTGTADAVGGVYSVYRNPLTSRATIDGEALSTITNSSDSRHSFVGRRPISVKYIPTGATSAHYHTSLPNVGDASDALCIVLETATPMEFVVEAVAHFEMIGRYAPAATMSRKNEAMYERIVTAAQSVAGPMTHILTRNNLMGALNAAWNWYNPQQNQMRIEL